ncbi:MAG: dihydropteroate synthase [Lachnospiraceae bacterium]|nr:dihydropteroate synthase [Lachnospiraceae bacterium]
MIIGKKEFLFGEHTYIMGILNVTPDSFSDGGSYNTLDAALRQAERLEKSGCDILDIGGESTRPGYTKLSDGEEIERVAPVIEAVSARFDLPISLDTYKAGVARAGLEAGADLINDIWGLRYDDGQMAQVIAQYDVPCCLMHNRQKAEYGNLIPEIIDDLKITLEIAQKAGIKRDKIILDPGVGFGKTCEHNLQVLAHMKDLRDPEAGGLDYPWLLGASRKSVIGLTLDLPADEREEGTLVTTVMAAEAGWQFVRVHDAEKSARAIRMTEAILGSRQRVEEIWIR